MLAGKVEAVAAPMLPGLALLLVMPTGILDLGHQGVALRAVPGCPVQIREDHHRGTQLPFVALIIAIL
jgi:hypothetical protein